MHQNILYDENGKNTSIRRGQPEICLMFSKMNLKSDNKKYKGMKMSSFHAPGFSYTKI